jgi:hypothetical protein
MEIDNEESKIKHEFYKGVSSIIGASIINLVYPSIFALNTFIVYQTSYIKNNGGNVNINHTMFYYPVVLFFQSIFGLIAGVIYSRIEVHWSNFLGTFLLLLASFILYISKLFFLDMLSMAIYGIGIAIIMFPATTNACKYFKNHIGLVNGIVETFISLGSTIFAYLGERIINPEEEKSRESDNLYEPNIADRFKIFVLVQIGCFIVTFILCLFLIKKYKEKNLNQNEKEQLLPSTMSKNNININTNINANNELKTKNYHNRKIKLKKVLKSWEFWRYNIISLSQSPISDMVFAMYRGIGESKDIDQTILQLIGTLNFIIEFILSFVYGVLCDYVNFKILLFSMNIIGTIVGFTYCLTFNSSFFFTLATLSISVQSAAYYSLKDYHLMKVFGTEIYVDLSGFVTFFTGIVVLILTFITYYVEESLANNDTGYWIMFSVFGAINGVGVILGFFEEDNPFDYGENSETKIEQDNSNKENLNQELINQEILNKNNQDNIIIKE